MRLRTNPDDLLGRAEMLAQYPPIQAGIQRVLREAMKACGRPDMNRAIKQVAPWAEEEEFEDEQVVEMLADVALFEPNQRGRRAYDRFLTEKAGRLGTADRALAERMATAWFSLFRVAGRHEIAGLWLEDVLAENRRLWMMDEAFETSAIEGCVVGLRLFDAGPFHAGFGIIAQPDEETVEYCLAAKARGNPLPFRHSLAATLYGDLLLAEAPLGPDDLAMMQHLFEMLTSKPDILAGAKPRASRQKRPRPRKLPEPLKGD